MREVRRGVAQLGRALASGVRGREFESLHPDHSEFRPRSIAIIERVFYNFAVEERETPVQFRRCRLCYERKPISEFHRRGVGNLHWCKACRKDYDAAYFQQRRVELIAGKRRREAELVARMRALKSEPCADCGGRFHPAAMTFDHLPGTNKRADIATLVRRSSIKLARQEMAKCELVCANCHAIRTYERRERSRHAAA